MTDAEHAAVLRRRLEKWWDRFDPAEKAAMYRAFELLERPPADPEAGYLSPDERLERFGKP